LGCIENGSAWGPLAGEAGVGTHGGSEDHVAILNARPGHVSHYGYVPVQHRGEVPLPAGWTLLVASSGVQAEKTGAAMADYNRAADAVHRMQAWWNAQAAEPVTSLVDVLAQGDAEGQLRHWMSTQPDGAWLAHRLQHLQREHVRVAQAAQTLAGGDVEMLGGLAAASQADAEALLGNQIAETSALVELARGLGAGAASAFGAGYGGSVWALVPTAEAETLAHAWRTAYLRRWPPHEVRCEVCVAQPGPGAFALPPVPPT
jgi:galactokinase